MVISKTNFLGGINELSDITKLNENEYWILINARVRKNAVEAIKLPLDVTNNLSILGNIQDIVAVGDRLVAFAGGKAFYKTVTGTWNLVDEFLMNSTQPRVYSELIPASTINYVRSASGASGTLTLGGPVGASPSALIVMDGVKQPWIILPDGSSRATGNYESWIASKPEYVPIANFPMFANGVLYAVMPDGNGKLNQIVRSVTGSPLNFVVAVTPDGDKTSSIEAQGGALTMAHNVDYNNITCLASANSIGAGFFVGTQNSSYLVYPDFNKLIYAEPTFTNQSVASIGPLNRDSIVDVLGDVAFVHDTGIRSFNGIAQFRFEGRNAPFSGPINSLLDGITQTSAACGTHDNYALFALTTIYGNGILWYDTLLGKFVSLDIYPGVGNILKFASVIDNGQRYTYFMTTTGIYQLFGSSQRATVTLYGSEVVPTDDYKSIKLLTARFGFNRVREGGLVEASLYVNGQFCNRKAVQLNPMPTNVSVQSSIPFNSALTDGVVAAAEFNFQDNSPEGDRIGILLRFDTDGLLVGVSADMQEGQVWPKVNAQGTLSSVGYETFAILGNDGIPDAIGGASGQTFTATEVAERKALNARIRGLSDITKIIGTGNHTYGYPLAGYNPGSENAINVDIRPFWDAVKDKLLFVPGIYDNNTAAAANLFSYLQRQRYVHVTTQYADIYLINSGFNSSFVNTETDNNYTPPATIASSTQFVWLRNALASGTKKHKWVVMHQPPFTSGVDYYNANDANPVLSFIQAVPFKNWGATALICGLSGLVERLDWDGLPIIISGAGGKTPTTVNNPPSPRSRFAKGGETAYWEATVNKLSVEFVCKSKTGAILDRYFQPV